MKAFIVWSFVPNGELPSLIEIFCGYLLRFFVCIEILCGYLWFYSVCLLLFTMNRFMLFPLINRHFVKLLSFFSHDFFHLLILTSWVFINRDCYTVLSGTKLKAKSCWCFEKLTMWILIGLALYKILIGRAFSDFKKDLWYWISKRYSIV